jgi:hypothetical protein
VKSRQTNRAKQVDPSCKNNGTCPWCYGNRQAANVRAEPIEQLDPVEEREWTEFELLEPTEKDDRNWDYEQLDDDWLDRLTSPFRKAGQAWAKLRDFVRK